MTLAYGFFNSVGGDRLYNAEDFSRYLEGIIVNGCFPNDTGFKALANSEPIGTDPPSIIISAGKAYYDGMWIYNDQSYIYSLGTEQQIIPGMYHLVYFCYDTNDNAREVTIECLTSATPIIPTNGSGKYYMPLALVADQMNAQPEAADITDQRLYAGVSAIDMDFDASSITTGTLDIGRLPNLPASKVTSEEFSINRIPSIPMTKLSPGMLQWSKAASGVVVFTVINTPYVACSTSGAFTVDRNYYGFFSGYAFVENNINGIEANVWPSICDSYTGGELLVAGATIPQGHKITIPLIACFELTAGSTYAYDIRIKSSIACNMTVTAGLNVMLIPR